MGESCRPGRAQTFVEEALESPGVEVLADIDIAAAVDGNGMGHVE